MKTKILILSLILLVSCTNKPLIREYLVKEINYELLSGHADFILKDQQGVLEYGMVSIFDTDPPTVREATQDDKLKAVDLCYKMETLKSFLDEASVNCNKIRALYKGKNIFNSGKRNVEIELYKGFIKITENSILEVTGGVKLQDYMKPYLSKNLRDMMNSKMLEL